MNFLRKLSGGSSHVSSSPKSFDDLMNEFDEAAGDPQKQAKILQLAANLAKDDVQKFRLATKFSGFEERYGTNQ